MFRTLTSILVAVVVTASIVVFSPTASGADLRERLGIDRNPTYVLTDQ